jgi:hypothetical protein
MRESELQLRVKLLLVLKEQLAEEDSIFDPADAPWFDGIRYAMHIIREADLDG